MDTISYYESYSSLPQSITSNSINSISNSLNHHQIQETNLRTNNLITSQSPRPELLPKPIANIKSNDARWESPNQFSSEPKIVSSLNSLKNDDGNGSNKIYTSDTESINLNRNNERRFNGNVMGMMKMVPLEVQVDPVSLLIVINFFMIFD